MKKIILWSLIIFVLLGMAYFGFREKRTFNLIFGNNGFESLLSASKADQSIVKKNSIENFGVKIEENLSGILNKGKSFTVKTIQEIKEKIKEKTKEKTFEITQGVLKSVEETAGNILNINSDEINSKVLVNQNSPIEFFSYLIKINTPVSFIIRNPFSLVDAENINYQIDWGDGKKDGGGLKTKENITVSHFWNKEGEYLVQFSVKSESAFGGKISTIESEKFDYQIKILVL